MSEPQFHPLVRLSCTLGLSYPRSVTARRSLTASVSGTPLYTNDSVASARFGPLIFPVRTPANCTSLSLSLFSTRSGSFFISLALLFSARTAMKVSLTAAAAERRWWFLFSSSSLKPSAGRIRSPAAVRKFYSAEPRGRKYYLICLNGEDGFVSRGYGLMKVVYVCVCWMLEREGCSGLIGCFSKSGLFAAKGCFLIWFNKGWNLWRGSIMDGFILDSVKYILFDYKKLW